MLPRAHADVASAADNRYRLAAKREAVSLVEDSLFVGWQTHVCAVECQSHIRLIYNPHATGDARECLGYACAGIHSTFLA